MLQAKVIVRVAVTISVYGRCIKFWQKFPFGAAKLGVCNLQLCAIYSSFQESL